MKEEGWGYCTEFLIHGPGLDPEALRDELGALGESALVVGDPELVRVHIHTGEPAPLIALASSRGRLSKLKVEDMSAQHHDVLDRADAAEQAGAAAAPRRTASARRTRRARPSGWCRWRPGDGFRDILASLGADAVVEGGQTMNPSIEDLLNAVPRRARGEGGAAAQQRQRDPHRPAGRRAHRRLRGHAWCRRATCPRASARCSRSSPTSTHRRQRARMAAAIEHVHALEVTRAVRDSTANGHEIKEGDVLGILDDEIREVGGDEPQRHRGGARARRQGARAGHRVPRRRRDRRRRRRAGGERCAATLPDTEFELHDGGQEHYSYVLSLE